jgi:hypothetical protein
MIPRPPHSSDQERVAALRRKFEKSISEAIEAAQRNNQWPAVAQVPADCHVRDVKRPVLEKYRVAGWLVFHGMGNDTIRIRRRPASRE